MNDSTVFIWLMLIIFASTLAFCGEPDLHDNLIEATKPSILNKGE